jgi:hypothetical protein
MQIFSNEELERLMIVCFKTIAANKEMLSIKFPTAAENQDKVWRMVTKAFIENYKPL